ncbi:MAG: phosphoribosylformylglycinamidine synthase subunit PurQ [Candidatus Thermoplasmatota archaeon]|nr:phosphoribosylformylglycinamidine synthase subunit PurQ [Candidatus Thermoplasmatota archaeon]MBS3790048.1 phosphoribosylformylglycinamidine synthase subunit PurQ [Candidatus Thermoplasmatota archaeon]
MKREDIKAGVLRIEGTNCEEESHLAFKRLGAQAEKVHLKQLIKKDVDPEEEREIHQYDILMIPGGFSAGDYIRAGAIFGARIKSRLGEELKAFVKTGKPILGVCNGFQVLVEIGLLPAVHEVMSEVPSAALETNDSNKFECRPSLLRVEENSNCVFTTGYEKHETILYPSAHKEGKFVLGKNLSVDELEKNDQIVFRYTTPDGSEPEYPWNPNGSLDHIAGICNPEGNVLGLMPHPERVFNEHTRPDWTRDGMTGKQGDGKQLFESALNYLEDNF